MIHDRFELETVCILFFTFEKRHVKIKRVKEWRTDTKERDNLTVFVSVSNMGKMSNLKQLRIYIHRITVQDTFSPAILEDNITQPTLEKSWVIDYKGKHTKHSHRARSWSSKIEQENDTATLPYLDICNLVRALGSW